MYVLRTVGFVLLSLGLAASAPALEVSVSLSNVSIITSTVATIITTTAVSPVTKVTTATSIVTSYTSLPPPPPPPPPPSPYIDIPKDAVNKCGSTNFTDETTEGSPFVADCLQIVKNIARGGSWEVEEVMGNEHQLVQHGTCAFAVKPWRIEMNMAMWYKLGNEDIMSVIQDSAKQFARNGKLGASGQMHCQSAAPLFLKFINWRIFKNGTPVCNSNCYWPDS
ncbi:hypothetical protein DL546_000626 [Coniochaeta pulveracea]|uniref:Ecp2 effector protein-like domain-containing protein n=1 Tax=Coniochaeta pulveracea TaxID=177199 RepID=A0A420XW36_9PEZI|nr:hypothetical protein DL546_000626 [Coniochaeta pulveracea]